jgi:L-lactate dehydrogenase complex protein LldG
LLDQLCRTATSSGWKVHRATTNEEAVGYIVTVIKEQRAGQVVRSSHEVLNRIHLDTALSQQGARVTTVAASRTASREELREEMAHRAIMGITGVDYAIAETGTCVLVPRKGVSRAVSLLPPLHVAIVEPDQVYETLDDLFALRRLAFLQGRGEMGSYLSLITGPSRTADIEQTIVEGVHGPVEAHMVLLEATAVNGQDGDSDPAS